MQPELMSQRPEYVCAHECNKDNVFHVQHTNPTSTEVIPLRLCWQRSLEYPLENNYYKWPCSIRLPIRGMSKSSYCYMNNLMKPCYLSSSMNSQRYRFIFDPIWTYKRSISNTIDALILEPRDFFVFCALYHYRTVFLGLTNFPRRMER